MTRAVLIAVVVLAVGGAAVVGAGGDSGDAGSTYTIVMDNSFGLTEGADLKSSGVRVGTIDKLDVQRGTARALVTAKVTETDFAGFRRDVFCQVQPQSLIGEYFLDCDPGRAAAPAPRTIPVEQTAGTIPPDLVLNIMRRPARERFGLILAELGAGFAARGDDLQATIRRAVPALRETDAVLKILGDNRQTLRALTREADTVLARLDDNRGDVARFVAEARDSAAASAARRTDLAASVNRLPRFLAQLRPTLRDLGTTARLQAPALADLRAAAPDLTTLFARLGPFSQSARPAVSSLGRASQTGVGAATAARSTVRRLKRLGTRSTDPMRNLRFVLEDLDDRGRAVEPNRLSPGGQGFTGLEALLQYPFVQSQAVNIFDSKGYILKLNVLINECSQYTNAQTARENAERTKRCSQALGPNQPGITSDVAPGATQRSTRTRSPRTPAARETPAAPAPAAAPAPTPQAAQPAPADQPKGLLDKLLPGLPDLPDVGPLKLGQRDSGAPRADGDRGLLDFLLGP
jgi:ABC-type transporter Mla subunit MlaD